MKVYQEKSDRQSMLPGIGITALFLTFGTVIISTMLLDEGSWLDKLSGYGMPLLFALVFLYFGFYFLYFLIKKPVKFKAKLISKDVVGRKIYLTLKIQKEKEQKVDLVGNTYRVYVYEDSNFSVGNYYSIGLKEFNWEVVSIDDYSGESNVKVAVPGTAHNLVFGAIIFILAGGVVLCLLGLYFYPAYSYIYLAVAGLFLIGIGTAYQMYKSFK